MSGSSASVDLIGALMVRARRRLWRAEALAVARLALFAAAGWLLLISALHLALRPIGAVAALAGVALVLLIATGRAVARRPSQADGALWADRQLDGATAFSTWAGLRASAPRSDSADALRWFEAWAEERARHALVLLSQRHDPAGLGPPLATLLVGAALTSLILTRPDASLLSAPASARAPTDSGQQINLLESQGATGSDVDRQTALAKALQAAANEPALERRPARQSPGAGAGRSAPDAEAPVASAASGAAASPPGPAGASLARAIDSTRSSARQAGRDSAASGGDRVSGSGREAGDSVDEGGDPVAMREQALDAERPAGRPGSAAPPAPMHPPAEARPNPRPGLAQADADRAASFDAGLDAAGSEGGRLPVPAAAAAPRASSAVRLSSSQQSYVQAWIQALRQPR